MPEQLKRRTEAVASIPQTSWDGWAYGASKSRSILPLDETSRGRTGTRTIIDIVEALERRRSPKGVVVEKFNVNAGGKAIVGNFEIRKESDRESPTGSDSPPADNRDTED